MMLATGTVEYTLGTAPITGCGMSYTTSELESALAGPVAEVIFDDAGTADLTNILSGLPSTEFNPECVKRVLENNREHESWRVGEALAESYLTHHRTCTFPWPDGRDERKSGSSLPGADLVGIHCDGVTERFAFGEVKTSSENKYPPGAMYGRTGLKQQLEDLRDKVGIRDDLVKYLWHRAVNASWKDKFINAFKRYNTDNADVGLFGVLLRDVEPHEDDLRARVGKLGEDCPQPMSIELLALYMPSGSIGSLGEKVLAMRAGVAHDDQ
ncbi:MAG: hypothetical protein C4B59_05290 [Candidatus Methanogaster sp.]|uniref:Uncharacterized protein n=1 Tax=Candidatus Methanogaster sp. TaxID=3386292 RepID=A0AC61L3X8_9EURY|nr:MAG: hypothetical protein C4B59_05290 [ANME-2 cluster archaeon]